MADNSRVTPEDFNSNSRLRASDADRDRAASMLNEAMAQGRLTAEEHADRLDAIYAAKTHADLVPILDDLPGMSAAVAPAADVGAVAPAATGSRLVAIFGGISRKGRWHPEPLTRILTVFGGVAITVPPEMRVIDTGSAIMGGREIAGDSTESAAPDAPVLRITGTCVCGGVEVKRRPRRNRRPRKNG
jgi:Domain of unknown function (DUF1707)